MSAPFQFKSFTIQQDKCAMKVGTDGVLLGAWANAENAERILDIGTGTGVIALMLGQRAPEATIVGVDIDKDACMQAEENVQRSPWSERVHIIEASIQEFTPKELYDLIVSNPPYFENSMKTGEHARDLARHNDSLGYTELIFSVNNFLTEKGSFCTVLPVTEGEQFIKMARTQGLYCVKKCEVFPTPDKPVKRLLLEFKKKPEATEMQTEKLVIELDQRHQYSEEYINLTKDFYLKF
jgi:tRNA1Val (adenine37-N6)-methyltransferase